LRWKCWFEPIFSLNSVLKIALVDDLGE